MSNVKSETLYYIMKNGQLLLNLMRATCLIKFGKGATTDWIMDAASLQSSGELDHWLVIRCSLQSIMKLKIHQRRPLTYEQLESCIRPEWDNNTLLKLSHYFPMFIIDMCKHHPLPKFLSFFTGIKSNIFHKSSNVSVTIDCIGKGWNRRWMIFCLFQHLKCYLCSFGKKWACQICK